MKVAYLVASSDISGGQRVIFQQAEALANQGCEITLVCPEPKPIWFPLLKTQWEMSSFDESKALADADIRVATFWTTVAPAVRDFDGSVFHLCQGYEADFSFNAPKREEIESAYAKTTHKLAVSSHVADRLRDAGYTPVSYVGQTFDPLEFPPRKKRPFDQNLPAILLIGIFEADVKGIREASTALADLRQSGVGLSLRRISTWPLSMEEKRILMPDRYDIRLTPLEMGRAYRDSDLLIGPSHPEEGFDLPVLEALSSGLPTLLSDTPGHRYIAGAAAEYFTCGNSKALGLKVANLLADRPRRVELSAKGPLRTARFRTTDVANRLLAEFEKALDLQ